MEDWYRGANLELLSPPLCQNRPLIHGNGLRPNTHTRSVSRKSQGTPMLKLNTLCTESYRNNFLKKEQQQGQRNDRSERLSNAGMSPLRGNKKQKNKVRGSNSSCIRRFEGKLSSLWICRVFSVFQFQHAHTPANTLQLNVSSQRMRVLEYLKCCHGRRRFWPR